MVLRECQKADTERVGLVSRAAFLGALEFAALEKTMSLEFMNNLANTYLSRDGLVDYLSCFRNYLNELIAIMPSSVSELKLKPATKSRMTRGNHPWDFEYTREAPRYDMPTTPYWQSASLLKTPEMAKSAPFAITNRPKSAVERSRSSMDLSDQDRTAILQKYDPRVVLVCAKCHDAFLPIWRSIRNEFKRCQINSKNGCILASTFLAVLEHFGIRLSSTEMGLVMRAFRELGTLQADVVRYDDFLRVCLVAKAIVN